MLRGQQKKGNAKHTAWHLPGELINDGRSLRQIANTFNVLHRPTQCLRCWGLHAQKRGENNVYKLVNASIVIKMAKK
jgi:hypothetical protein